MEALGLELQKRKRILIGAAYALLIILVVCLCVRYLLPFILPFLLGFLIAWCLRPAVRFITRHSGMSTHCASVVTATVFYLVLALIIWLLGSIAVTTVQNFFEHLPGYYRDTVLPLMEEVQSRADRILRRFSQPRSGQSILKTVAERIGEQIGSGLSTDGMSHLTRAAGKLPAFIVAAIFTVLSSVMICGQYEAVTAFLLRQIPQRFHLLLRSTHEFLVSTLLHLIRAYLILTGITFIMLCAGLFVLHAPRFLPVAALIAILDLLPVLGSGVVLIPWSIYSFLGHDIKTGVGLLILWAAISLVRQVAEPRVIGKQIGLHPLVSLISMYIGLRLAGVAGLIVAPIVCLLLLYLHRQGVITLYKS